MWFKNFNLDWFGKKKMQGQLDIIVKNIKDLSNVVQKDKSNDKAYKNGYYTNSILTIVFHNGDVISMPCKPEYAKQLNDCKNEDDIRKLFDINVINQSCDLIKPKYLENELETNEIFIDNSIELLEILGSDFYMKNSGFYYKHIKLPIPTILLNALLQNKKQGNILEYQSLINFWLWTSLNPIQTSREDLFSFIRKNDVKLTPGGLLVLYRRIVNVNKSSDGKKIPTNQKLESIISLEYFKTKKDDKKSPKDYSIILINDEFKRVKAGKESNYEIVGNLYDLYINLSAVPSNMYTDNHTRTMKIQIGTVYKIDEDLVDINSRNDCSTGLHVASKRYDYGSFGDTPVLCLVNPSKVRSVPIGECSKMRVSEMFIASELEHDGNNYMDDDINIVPFEDEYSKVTLEELEEASKNGFEDVKPTVTIMAHKKKDNMKILSDIKKQISQRLVKI